MPDPDLIGRNLLKPGYKPYSGITQPSVSSLCRPDLTLSQALKHISHRRALVSQKSFDAAAQRACTYLVEACGTKDLDGYSRSDALKYMDYLIAKGLVGSSVSHVMSSIRADFNFAISEYALDLKNPFTGFYFDKTAWVSKRLPIPIDDIRKVQEQYRFIDDEMRWWVTLVSDTGLRLAEAAGLLKSDLILDVEIPFVRVSVHPWRAVKTSGSIRVVPLTNASLWSARRILNANPDSVCAFPRYNKTSTTNANSASAALNKWLHQYVPLGCTMHSFRHSLRDRLRAAECHSAVIDQIGGWNPVRSIGKNYG